MTATPNIKPWLSPHFDIHHPISVGLLPHYMQIIGDYSVITMIFVPWNPWSLATTEHNDGITLDVESINHH